MILMMLLMGMMRMIMKSLTNKGCKTESDADHADDADADNDDVYAYDGNYENDEDKVTDQQGLLDRV